jgi:hypothetical protein
MPVLGSYRLTGSRRDQSEEEHAACQELARAWCGLIADAADLHDRLAATARGHGCSGAGIRRKRGNS